MTQHTAVEPRRAAEDWWRQAVVYQVYPRSFADADGDGLGDIRGVTSRLPYLRDLGVDAVWLSPFYPSALADGGYDVDDYRDVDPRLGTLDDVDAMVAEAHRLGLKVVVDIVPNHSSDRHVWFQEALASPPGSPARDRYVFRDGRGPDGSEPPSDWMSHFGGRAWTRVPDGQWYLHLFTREQPDFNWDNPEVREDFLTTLRFWSDRGVDGFRVDVAHGLAKDLSHPLRDVGGVHPDALTGIPLDGSHPYFDREEVHEIFREWREVLDEYDPPRSAVAEAWVANSRRVLYARPDELGQAFNFELVRAPWSAPQVHVVIDDALSAAAAAGASATWVLSNHDVVRHVSRYALPPGTDLVRWLLSDGTEPEPDLEQGLRRARAATLLMLALPGSAYVYQGEELGLPEVADLPRESLQDPIWFRTEGADKGRDGCRVPIPWEKGGASFGFGPSGEPWLPQPAWYGDLSVEAQDGVADSTLELYRDALRLRRELQGDESLEWLHDGDVATTLHLRRSTGWESFTNFAPEPVPLPDGEVLLASGPLGDGELPGETTVWLRR
ncbi:glycoside hydrolase family 13 protein [Cellulomonas carbonis]|uniref:Alpha-amylase n=1 Tax=Cellulomonas carbonis T26 TaxID=947969 RepID=A0A0A0BN34_9CELL|nr:glycoside hydrolase family 13 protein [Cellulomonas carbonis]KGM09310.1 alpha-amylase [Cellulomonas carbonis T26]GGC13293.1 glycosidase [Cellulomonas carbonis]